MIKTNRLIFKEVFLVIKNRLQSLTIRCPKCQSSAYVKDGIIKEKQRFKCKECFYHYTVLHRGISNNVRRQAVQLYLAGLSFRSIGKLLQCSHVTVSKWINEYGETLKSIRAMSEIKVIKTKHLQDCLTQNSKTEMHTAFLVIDIQHNTQSLCIPIFSN